MHSRKGGPGKTAYFQERDCAGVISAFDELLQAFNFFLLIVADNDGGGNAIRDRRLCSGQNLLVTWN